MAPFDGLKGIIIVTDDSQAWGEGEMKGEEQGQDEEEREREGEMSQKRPGRRESTSILALIFRPF